MEIFTSLLILRRLLTYAGLFLAVNLVGHGQLLATLGTTSSEHAATIGGLHALTETMLIITLAVVGLECSFHSCTYVLMFQLTP